MNSHIDNHVRVDICSFYLGVVFRLTDSSFVCEMSACRPTLNLSFTAYSDKLSASLSFRTPFWSIGTRKYQQRRYRKSFLLQPQKHAIKTSQMLWRVRAGPTASLAQSSRTVVASETLLSFSYLPPSLNREDGDGNGNGEGGMAYSSSSGVVDAREMKRRERIARANKGKVPWNKGRRHSPGMFLLQTNLGWDRHKSCALWYLTVVLVNIIEVWSSFGFVQQVHDWLAGNFMWERRMLIS